MKLEDTFTIHEIFEKNSCTFPFWVKNRTAKHKVMKVLYRHKYWNAFIGETYSLDHRRLIDGKVRLNIDDSKGWLPD